MGRDEETRQKSKKHKRDREKERHEYKDVERATKRSRGDKALGTQSPVDLDLDAVNGKKESLPRPDADRELAPKAEDASGEVSMSIEETNKYVPSALKRLPLWDTTSLGGTLDHQLQRHCRIRLSLGLKPLQIETSAEKERAAHASAVAAKAEERRKEEEAALAEHIKE